MSDYARLAELSVSVQHVKNCAFSQWYHKFEGHTPKAQIVKPVAAGFMKYLEQDGIELPNDSNFGQSSYFQEIQNTEDNDYSDWEDDSNDGEVLRQDSKSSVVAMFPELHEKLKAAFREMGPLTPKLTWSSPKDATWILANNTLKCQEVNDLYLLLKASNYITHDLDRAFDECYDREEYMEGPESITHELILRKWFDINPALEFRVFVEDSRIVAVSQRDLNYYDYLLPLIDTFKDLLDDFIEETVNPKFPDKSYVCDVYIPRPFKKIWLIDFNPFARKTDPLLFSWNELVTIKANEADFDFEFRLVHENNVARFAGKEHSESQVPKDVADAITNPNAIKELAQKWSELMKMQQADESSSDDDGN
ncbi:LANO_0E01904g1_1 [Lachancea nothofagi CBS 11611]|uniref:Translation initiation factor eIF2 assembly protein n=1 Tax=Lachancea nothofagi CBS 11611 TaxID=1266666 RepID=A0A1G4JPR9_9SACH|nr:LANO_0E01904g1_1 [Lachancea nothofagi CBS 11611]